MVVHKFGTGHHVPKGAQYLTTIVQETVQQSDNVASITTRLVWHYFLVKEEGEL